MSLFLSGKTGFSQRHYFSKLYMKTSIENHKANGPIKFANRNKSNIDTMTLIGCTEIYIISGFQIVFTQSKE